jgi:hypothetical protein
LEIEQLAELDKMLFVIAIEKYLVEAGEAQNLLVAVEFHSYGDHASARTARKSAT